MEVAASFLTGALLSIVLVLASTAIFYEIIAYSWVRFGRINGKRKQMLFAITALFLAHTLVIWLFAGVFYALDLLQMGGLTGSPDDGFFQFVYFSGVSYSSLGFGNIDATGSLELLTVVESILGLTFIGWSVAFSYVMTERYLHKGSQAAK